MQEYVRCKVCGFIIEAGKEGELCPACGIPKTAFEPYKMNISQRRKKLIDLHIHPIIIHFPQAFASLAFFLLILSILPIGNLKATIINTLEVILTLLPFAVMVGFISGLYDGKLRFKKVTTPILKKKIVFGSAFIILSIVSAIIFMFAAEKTNMIIWAEILLLLFCNACAAGLGKMGASIMDSKLPG